MLDPDFLDDLDEPIDDLELDLLLLFNPEPLLEDLELDLVLEFDLFDLFPRLTPELFPLLLLPLLIPLLVDRSPRFLPE